MKKIIFCIKDPNGGTGRFIEVLSAYFRDKGFHVIVLTHLPAAPSFRIHERVIGIPLQKGISLLSLPHIFFSLINLWSVTFFLLKERPDVIFSMDIYANIAITPSQLFLPHTKIIKSTHVNLIQHIKKGRRKELIWVLNKVLPYVYNYAHFHYVPSRELGEQLVRRYHVKKEKLISIPYPVNVTHIKSAARTKKKYNGKKMILSFSRFDGQKNIDLLLRSFRLVVEKLPSATLVLCGGGKEKTAIMKKIRNLDLVNRVILHEWLENPYVLLNEASLFVLITHYEGFPYSLIEAVTLGVPCVASDVEFGPREIIHNKTQGILLSVQTPKLVAQAILSLLGKKQRRKINDVYDIKKIGKKYLDLFN